MTPNNTFLLDENIDVRVGAILRKLGHTVAFGEKGLKNGELFSSACQKNAILVTLDKDFANTDLYPPAKTMSIVILRVHPPKLENLKRVLEKFLHEYSRNQLLGKTHLVSDKGIESQGG